jgi:hypothetical protein
MERASQLDVHDRLARTFQQCSSRVSAARSVSRNVTTNRRRSAKTLLGTGPINSLASSGSTEQHALSSEPQCRATLLIVSNAAPSADFDHKSPGQAATPPVDFDHKSPSHGSAVNLLRPQVARCLRNQPPTSNIKKLHFKLRIAKLCIYRACQ